MSTRQGQIDRLLLLIAEGVGFRTACSQVGIRPSAATTLLEDPTLKPAFEDALARRDEAVEEALWQSARSGSLNAIKFYLTNRNPTHWREAPPTSPSHTTNIQINAPALARQIAENPEASQLALDALTSPEPKPTQALPTPTPTESDD